MRVTVVDSGMGNLHSVVKALRHVGAEVDVALDYGDVARTDRLVLPGVGAFAENVRALKERQLWQAIWTYLALGRPFLGICVGMQMLFDWSEEFGDHKGFGIIPGDVVAMKASKVPHVGWNTLHGEWEGQAVYFVHSFSASPDLSEHVAATFTYGNQEHVAAVRRGNILGTQFHPEKSGEVGLAILRKWVNE